MIELSDQQARALQPPRETPLKVVDPRTQETFVLLRLEDYESLLQAQYDDGPWTDEERELLRTEAVDSLGWEGMEAYQDDQP
jgi:hypothetical protein